MAAREVHILSYFSLPTDLAAALRNWPEFRGGQGYAVDLSDARETVTVRRIEPADDASPYVAVSGQGDGPLFDRALGFVVHALAAHSDHLVVSRAGQPA
jgi:hypothetical protein